MSVNGGDFMALQFNQTNTSNGNGLNGVHQLSSCGNHSISLKATNVCGGGPSVTVVLTSTAPPSNMTSTPPPNVCESDTTPGTDGGTSSNKCEMCVRKRVSERDRE